MKRLVLWILLIALTVAGCSDDEEQFDFLVPPGPPQAADDNYQMVGNVQLTVAANQGLLVNDPVPAPVVQFQNPSAQGGVVAVSADGSFTYTPPAGFRGTDTFTYTTGNAGGQSTATATIQVPALALFVNNTAAGGGAGTLASPFNTLNAALAAAAVGDTIFVFRGDGTNTGLAGAVDLLDGQQLIGEGSGLTLNGAQIVPADGFPNLTGPINLADGVTVRGLRIDGAAGSAIVGIGVDGSDILIDNNQIANPGDDGVTLENSTGLISITNNTFEGINVEGLFDLDMGVDVVNAGATQLTLTVTGNTFTSTAGQNPSNAVGFVTLETTQVNATVSGNTVTGAAGTSWDDGINGFADGDSFLNVTASNNTFTDLEADGFDFAASTTADLAAIMNENSVTRPGGNGAIFFSDSTDGLSAIFNNGTITDPGNVGLALLIFGAGSDNAFTAVNNDIVNAGVSGLSLSLFDGVLAPAGGVSGNTITNPGFSGIDLVTVGGEAALALTDNTITGAAFEGLFLRAFGDSSLVLGMRNNQLTGNNTLDIVADFTAAAEDNSNLCLAATGNSAEEYWFSQAGTAVFSVENFANFAVVNSGIVTVVTGTITDVAAGNCSAP
ncbi:MAG: cadherin-like domain-containing protein [Armatimonadetes bacterium]|nr:cadherin-like domain-containing protein [Armatimonadota bacterium]